MEQTKKIELIIQLRNTALTIWGYLITVSLGITAYLGSLESPRLSPLARAILIILYLMFAASNARALFANFKSRVIISQFHTENEEEHLAQFMALNSFNNRAIFINMVFHAVVDLCVVVMIVNSV